MWGFPHRFVNLLKGGGIDELAGGISLILLI
jgi:hypothetical protein